MNRLMIFSISTLISMSFITNSHAQQANFDPFSPEAISQLSATAGFGGSQSGGEDFSNPRLSGGEIATETAQRALSQPVSYYVLNQDVKSVFADLSKIVKIPIVVAPSVKGKATSGKYQGTTEDLLDMVCKDLNLHWYFDGNSFYITRASDAVTRVFSLSNFSYKDLTEALDSVGIDYKRFPLKFDADRNILMLYGPPRFVAGVEAIADNIITFRSRSRPSVLRN